MQELANFFGGTIAAVARALKPVVYGSVQFSKALSKSKLRAAKYIVDHSDKLLQGGAELLEGDMLSAIAEVISIIDLPELYDVAKDVVGYNKTAWDKMIKDFKRANQSAKKRIKRNKEKKRKEKETMSKRSNKNGRSPKDGGRKENLNISRTNHPEWYLADATLTKHLVGINLATRQNADNGYIAGWTVTNDGPITDDFTLSVPSCAGIRMELVIPKSNTNDWNQAVNMLYKNVRSANAGSTNGILPYEYGRYIHNIRVIDAALSSLGRAITILNGSTFYDAVSPQAYFTAIGLDYDSFAANAANARELYNRLATIRYRLMPLNITLLDRTRWLFSNGFKDSDDAKAQIYFPYIRYARYIKPNDAAQLVVLGRDVEAEGLTGLEYSDFVTGIQTLFNLYQTDVELQTIAGDILKAYGASALNKYPDVPMTKEFTPVYDIHVLTQIQNATIAVTGEYNIDFRLEDPSDPNSFVITDVDETVNTGSGTYNANIYSTHLSDFDKWWVDPLYNANENIVDPGRLLSSTRLMTSRHGINSSAENISGDIVYDTFGTEIVETIKIPVFSKSLTSANPYGLQTYYINWIVPCGYERSDGESGAGTTPFWTWFDYFPLIMPVFRTRDPNSLTYSVVQFDFNNFGIAYKSNLDSYNAIATLSMLHKPFVAKTNRVEVIEA